MSAASQANFDRTNSSSPFQSSDPAWQLVQNPTSGNYTVTNVRTGEVWLFSFAPWAHLTEKTTQWWLAAGKVGTVYGSDGQITTAEGQSYNIVINYDSSNRVSDVEVNKSTTTLMKAEYTYFDVATHSPTIGSSGDLVQVKVSQLTSSGTAIGTSGDVVERYTQYRYDQHHRLTAILNHDGIMSLMANDPTDFHYPSDILTTTAATNYPTHRVTAHAETDFADRVYSYYLTATPHNPDHNQKTVFAPTGSGEQFYDEYGGLFTTETGMVLQGIDRPKGCAGCGGGGGAASGVRYDYYYMSFSHPALSKSDVVLLVLEDTSDSNGTPIKRRVWGLNNSGNILREATIKDPASSSPTYWCSSRILSSTGQVLEYRMNSAHTCVTDATALKKFLDPSTGTNDVDTVNASSGFIYVYEYDGNRLTATKTKMGEGTTYPACYESYIEYDTAAGIDLPARIRTYPSKVSSSPTSSGVYTQYNYTYWDSSTKTRIKTREIIPPVVGTGQNGSGAQTHLWEYYDEAGRLRWTKDGEGYVTYRAYSPATGSLAFQMRDVDTTSATSLGSEITTGDNSGTSGSDVKWEAWGSGTDSAPSDLCRPTSGIPSALKVVTKQEFDDLGRVTCRILPNGSRDYVRYEKYKTITFPRVDASTGVPALPVIVTKWDDAHRNTDVYTVDPAKATADGSHVPSGVTDSMQSDWVSWSHNHFDTITGALTQVDRYYKIPTSGDGSSDPASYYYTINLLNDAMGRPGATIEYVDASTYQVTTTLYNMFDRPVEMRRGVASSVPTSYATLSAALSSSPPSGFSGYAKVSSAEYDNGGIGDGYVTSSKSFYGTGDNDYIQTNSYYTFRGDLRGTKSLNGNDNDGDGADIKPYNVYDIDWQGRATGSAQYTGTAPTDWTSTVLTGDGYTDYVSGHSTDRNNYTAISYDDLGRVYSTATYPGTEATKHFQTDNFYDRNDNLVCTGDKYSAHSEYAYDGVGRQYQSRIVLDVASTPYSSGAFQYRAPAPNPSLDSMSTTGNDGLLQFRHAVFDASGNSIEQHLFELNSSQFTSIGIDIDASNNYIRRSVFNWYDAADRLKTTADYGAGDGTSATLTYWEYSTRPALPSEPSWTTSAVSNGYVLLTKYGYNDISGLPETVTTGLRQNGGGTDTTTTKTFYDALGRQLAVAENFVDYNAANDTGAGGSTNNEQDRVTKWAYYGSGRVKTLTAVNVTSSGTVNQPTEYRYTDNFNAGLVTLTAYPDGSTSGSDNVKLTYKLDGSLDTRTDQRGIVLTNVYDDARRLKRQEVSTTGGTVASLGVDDSILSIGRTYDTLGRVSTITSYSTFNGTGTVQNQLVYTYGGTEGRITKSEQSHQGAVTTGTPAVQYAYDTTVSSNVYTNGLRIQTVTYPSSRVIFNDYGADDSITDRLNRLYEIREGSATGTALTAYFYNGTSRHTGTTYLVPNSVDLKDRLSNRYYRFDRFGRVQTQEWDNSGSGGGVLDETLYTYDYAGNRLTRDVVTSTGDTRDQKYSYDGLLRLLNYDQGTLASGSITSSNKQRSWALDQLGNWAQTFSDLTQTTSEQTRTHNAANELTAINSSSSLVAEDPAGNMTTIPEPATPTASYTLTYDPWNRLVKTANSSGTVATYEYDGADRRIVHVDATSSTTYDDYYNERWQMLEEQRNAGTHPLAQYVWHPYYIDALAVRYYDASTSGTQVRQYYLQDANHNVTAVVDDSAAVLERYSYSPYGEVTFLNASFSSIASSTIGNNILFTARERDAETGLQINRWRYYGAQIGRWLTRDPSLYPYKGAQFNLYEYVRSTPVGLDDPNGLFSGSWNPVKYGNYCGPGGGGHAIDQLDACCKSHDNDYGNCGGYQGVCGVAAPNCCRRKADCQLKDCADAANCDWNPQCNTYRALLYGVFAPNCQRGALCQ